MAAVVSLPTEAGRYVKDLRAKTVAARDAADLVRAAFDERLAWRGNLSLTDAEYKVCPMPGFELFSAGCGRDALFASSEEEAATTRDVSVSLHSDLNFSYSGRPPRDLSKFTTLMNLC